MIWAALVPTLTLSFLSSWRLCSLTRWAAVQRVSADWVRLLKENRENGSVSPPAKETIAATVVKNIRESSFYEHFGSTKAMHSHQ